MSARDELAKVIITAYGEDAEKECPCIQDLDVADAILDDGYVKHRTITTVEELEEMPDGSVIRDATGTVRERFNDPETSVALWFRTGRHAYMLSRQFASGQYFPVTVLVEPEAQP